MGHKEGWAVFTLLDTLIAGSKDPNGPAENRPVLGHAGLCQEDLG